MTDQAPTTKVCHACKIAKPLSEYMPSPRNADGYELRCKPCTYARRREQEIARQRPNSLQGVNRHIDTVPDSRPPVRLRVELQRQRDAGKPFRAAWPPALRAALRGLTPREAAEWRAVFNATRPAWQGHYCGLPWPIVSGLSLFVPDDDRAVA